MCYRRRIIKRIIISSSRRTLGARLVITALVKRIDSPMMRAELYHNASVPGFQRMRQAAVDITNFSVKVKCLVEHCIAIVKVILPVFSFNIISLI